ncbi:MAG: flagella basal body P-ring formation protein FlgA [Candidatus Schekmanbacteria bacterium RBG_13_48_7]|uniref:Flagella basal body P-ring formation protein FlgA n=1 Tax=Candidatus Schekmanbacteria bacterium RBG_13_48_7 TaxID=1817878 RepID=A0A1F7RKY2_9BACT|nr:MAG: flagella basal body P-ring formation protein FlgA [Candidatus Schekmanbacteria bacterium RBG_13_48_7]
MKIIIILIILSGCVSQLMAEPIEVSLKNEVHVKGIYFMLKDVTDSGKLPEHLRELVLGRSPTFGTVRTTDKNHLQLMLRKSGITSEEVKITGNSDIRITRDFKKIDRFTIQKNILQFFIDWGKKHGREIKVQKINLSGDVNVPDMPISWNVELNDSITHSGLYRLTVNFEASDQEIIPLRCSAFINVFGFVPVAKSRIEKECVINQSHYTWENRELDKYAAHYPASDKDIIGMVIKNSQPAGSIISFESLRSSDAVMKGDYVIVMLNEKGICIKGSGTAMENCVPGDIIRITLRGSDKELEGILKPGNYVELR